MHETIGLLGGSFNPIHNGHLAMAEAALLEMRLDSLLIMPDGDPPHKAKGLAGKRHRLRMAELAANGRFAVSAMEVERSGKTYTVDTLEVMRMLNPHAKLVLIIGADTLREITTWKNAPRVFALCEFAVFAREGSPMAEVPGAVVHTLRTRIPEISSTALRARVHSGLSLEGLVPQKVESYIGRHRLYDPPVWMSETAIRRDLKGMLPNDRFNHTLGVVQTIRLLAARWGYDERKAALTGLLHDCAKGMNLSAMRAEVDRLGLRVDALRRENVALLHASAGMGMARAHYGVTDPEILHAIRCHNTGTNPMGRLDKLLILADMTEPNRKRCPRMEALRRLSVENLDQATAEALRMKWQQVLKRGGVMHPDTEAALEAMEQRMKEEENA